MRSHLCIYHAKGSNNKRGIRLRCKNNMKETDSFLMCDDSSHDGHHEAIMDYIISYTLRKTSSQFKETTPILYGYCISIFAKLLEIEGKHDDISFENIIVSKQDYHTDLWVKVDVSKDNKTFHHELIIENKYLSKIRENADGTCQLDDYKKALDSKTTKDTIKHYAVICYHTKDQDHFKIIKERADKCGFIMYPMSDLISIDSEDSESEIFNEFWLRNW